MNANIKEIDFELERRDKMIQELRNAIDGARRFTASDPQNIWCRQATIILDEAFKRRELYGGTR